MLNEPSDREGSNTEVYRDALVLFGLPLVIGIVLVLLVVTGK